jgi:hypothetical protein|nr:MAG TPA: hypothetical protein [Caudoviricetes sp.]
MNVKWQDIHTTLYMTTQFETDLAGLTEALCAALRSEDPDELRDALEWWVAIAHSHWTFAIGVSAEAGQLCKKLTMGSKASWDRVLSRVRSYGKGLEGIAKAMRCEPALFAIAYLTARMRDDLIDPSEVELILNESGWVN